MSRYRVAALVSVACALLCASVVHAQRAPDAGSILRDFGGGAPQQAQVLPPSEAPPPAPPADTGGARVLVKDFRIRATQFPEPTLRRLLDGYVGRELTLGELREAAFRISEYYRRHDVLGRAVIPRQDIRDGVVEIVVLEAKMGGAAVDPTSKSRLDADFAKRLVEHRAPPGQVIRPSQLQEGVAILNEIPGVAAAATMRPGSGQDETTVDLKIRDLPLVTGALQFDNQSARYIGRQRGILTTNLNDALGQGEQLSVLGLMSPDSTYGRAAAQVPVGTSGLVLGVNQSYLTFDLEGPFARLKQGGYAYSTGGTATYPFRRQPTFGLTGHLAFDHRRIVDRALDVDLDYRVIDAGTAGLSATLIDGWLGGGTNELGARLTVGHLDRSRNAADFAADSVSARTNGAYGKLALNAARLQHIVEDTDLYLSALGQASNKNLDSSEKFSLGGPYGVRAYPINEGNGDEGALVTVELRRRLPYGLTVFGLYDAGAIRVNHHAWENWQPVAGEPNHYVLQGAGVGVAWLPTPAAQIRLTYAHTIGPNPGHDAAGNNADGTQSRRQFWVVGRIAF